MKILFAAFLALSLISCNSGATNNNANTSATSAKHDTETVLKVIPLRTLDQVDSLRAKTFTYPPDFSLKNAAGLDSQVDAFGAAYKVWLGPKRWTGKGMIGSKGDVLITLLPPNTPLLAGPYIVYSEVSACASCILFTAAQYFPEALAKYNAEFNKNNRKPVKIPDSLKTTRVSPELVTYTKPMKNGASIQGAVFYTGTEHYYLAEFALPPQQSALSDFLMKSYINKIKQTLPK